MAARTQQAPLTAMLMMVTRERCCTVAPARSLTRPAQIHPTAPSAITQNAIASDVRTHGGTKVPAGTKNAVGFPASFQRWNSGPAKITVIHAHIEYSSHMCPKYPKLARRSLRLRSVSPILWKSNGGCGAAYGPSRTEIAAIKA